MILFQSLNLNHIDKLGKKYPWSRPKACLRCNHHRLWGHGSVSRFFDGFCKSLFMKCYRCPECGCVITMRPSTHFKWIQSPIQTIRSTLSHRLKKGLWPLGQSTSRTRHWLSKLRRNIKLHLSNAWDQDEIAGFDHLQCLGIVPVGVQTVRERILFQPPQ